MKKLLIIPDLTNLENSIQMAEEYNCGFEYNDFAFSSILEDEKTVEKIVKQTGDLSQNHFSTMHGAFLDVTIFSTDQDIRKISEKRVRQSLRIAEKLGIKGVVFHTNFIPTFRVKAYQDHWIKSNKEFFTQVLKEFPKLEIYMENMFDLDYDLIQRLALKMQEQERFGLCLDVGHANLSGVSIENWIRELAPFIKHLHMNDNDRISDGHLAFGEGTIDYHFVFTLLQKYKIEASVLIEVTGAERQSKCLEYLKGILPDYFKQGERKSQ